MQQPTNCTTGERRELRLTGRSGGLVEYHRRRTQRVDGSLVTSDSRSVPLPDEFAVLVDSSGRRPVAELDDEQRAWLDSEVSQ